MEKISFLFLNKYNYSYMLVKPELYIEHVICTTAPCYFKAKMICEPKW